MEIYLNNIADLAEKNKFRTAVALGRFDAMHCGHIEIIKKAVDYARCHKIKSLVYMFSNNPIEVITANKIPSVNTLKRRMELLESLGVDIVVSEDFNSEIMNMSCEDFVAGYLKNIFKAEFVSVGYNYSFGKGGAGNTEVLEKLCAKNNIKVFCADEVKADGKSVSSTIIRELISKGKVADAAKLMGRFHMLCGEVITGNGIGGSELGFPTANIELPADGILPEFGVYITRTNVGGRLYPSITNVGGKPTIDDTSCLIETYIEGSFGKLYGELVEVEFCEKIRDIIKFTSKKELIVQLGSDKQKMINYFEEE